MYQVKKKQPHPHVSTRGTLKHCNSAVVLSGERRELLVFGGLGCSLLCSDVTRPSAPRTSPAPARPVRENGGIASLLRRPRLSRPHLGSCQHIEPGPTDNYKYKQQQPIRESKHKTPNTNKQQINVICAAPPETDKYIYIYIYI